MAIAMVAVVLVAGAGLGAVSLAHRVWGSGHHQPPAAPAASAASTVSAPGTPATSGTDAAGVQAAEDAIANRPMLDGEATNADPSNFQPQMEVNATTPPLVLPSGIRQIAGTATGFPHTPAGAVAQLTAMQIAAYNNFDTDAGRLVYAQFAMPGSVSIEQWNPTKAVLAYYVANPSTNPAQMQATYTPVQGLIKGTVGSDFVLACLNGSVTYSYQGQSNTVAAWDCERMVWSAQQQQWMLGPGGPPAYAPLTWPRDALSYQAGFRDLTNLPA